MSNAFNILTFGFVCTVLYYLLAANTCLGLGFTYTIGFRLVKQYTTATIY